MTKKDFKFIANIIKNITYDMDEWDFPIISKEELTQAFCEALGHEYPRFDSAKFREACNENT